MKFVNFEWILLKAKILIFLTKKKRVRGLNCKKKKSLIEKKVKIDMKKSLKIKYENLEKMLMEI